MYDSVADTCNRMQVICRAGNIEHQLLSQVNELTPPVHAGQSFNLSCPLPTSKWICGQVGLPPGSAKEAEVVGAGIQHFRVNSGQPMALELAVGPASAQYVNMKKTTRFLLSPGDEFYIPSHNGYFLKNHSKKAKSELQFMIMKP